MLDRESNQIDWNLLAKLREDCKDSFSVIFKKYYKDLVLYAGNIIRDQLFCEDVVQNILLTIWNERHTLIIETSLRAYLLTSVRNKCLDELRHRKIVRNYETQPYDNLQYNDTFDYILYSDLYQHLQRAIDMLPEKQREAFLLNRIQDVKYKDIAKQLNVSQRTVEDRISKALASLRIELKDFLIILLIYVILSIN
ncbi:RNA polymerase sigma-70 factor [Dysgonomonas sp. ZJ279]|uniref:RNA polymerase sigma-70 factor n=1 Tax=Dysgonomonas sp. ZJ279 TaxID=2709796 RepID=UPI0013ED1482|nr:RNA polymerase sigma-70 factor [Dysgonomonas sp. ZJ279]